MLTLQHSAAAPIGLLAAVALLLIIALLDSSFLLSSSAETALDSLRPLSMAVAPRFSLESAHKQTVANDAIPPVQVLVAVESLCIDSQRFFHDQLMIAFNALPHQVMNLTVVPFGNAKLPSDDSRNISCQHGFGECDTNAYEQCAIHLYPDPAEHVPYLACLFQALPMGYREEPFERGVGLEPCAHEHHLDFGKLKKCHRNEDLVWKLQQQAAKATPTRHDHVPWTEVNGQYMDEESDNLLQKVCNEYRRAGGHTAGCSSVFEEEATERRWWRFN